MTDTKKRRVREIPQYICQTGDEATSFIAIEGVDILRKDTFDGIKHAIDNNYSPAVLFSVVVEDLGKQFTIKLSRKYWKERLQEVRDKFNEREEYDNAIDTHKLILEFEKKFEND